MIDFFIVGAVKAGTTSLHRYLAQHPSIEMSRVKWTRFFHVDGAEPDFRALAQRHGTELLAESVGRYRLMCHPRVPRTVAAYLDQWSKDPGKVLRGEAAPTYMYDEHACARIRARCPNAKIIMVLRMPIQRALSHFAMDLANNWVPERRFMDAVKAEPVQVDSFWWGLRHYLRHGFYARHLARARDTFGAKKLKVMLYDDMLSDPRAFMDEIVDFLGVKRFEFDLSKWHNSAPIEKPVLEQAELELLSRLYQPEVSRLQDMLGRDLHHWF
jgi:hypothetical protein